MTNKSGSYPISWLSKFALDPFDEAIPEKVKEVYQWDPLWNPHYNPEQYLQCTTFVAMVYNLNGISLKGRIHGDAKNWINLHDTFNVFHSGSSTSTPQVLDILVWADRGGNHVAIVIDVNEFIENGNVKGELKVLNSNASQEEFTFYYYKDSHGTVTINNKEGKTSKEDWVPSHWLQIKNSNENVSEE